MGFDPQIGYKFFKSTAQRDCILCEVMHTKGVLNRKKKQSPFIKSNVFLGQQVKQYSNKQTPKVKGMDWL